MYINPFIAGILFTLLGEMLFVLILAFFLSRKKQPMGYFNYHAKAKELINGGHLVGFEIVDNWNGIKPALVLHFDNNRSMPIRDHRWNEYWGLINK